MVASLDSELLPFDQAQHANRNPMRTPEGQAAAEALCTPYWAYGFSKLFVVLTNEMLFVGESDASHYAHVVGDVYYECLQP